MIYTYLPSVSVYIQAFVNTGLLFTIAYEDKATFSKIINEIYGENSKNYF